MTRQWTPPEVCPACGAALRPADVPDLLYSEYECGTYQMSYRDEPGCSKQCYRNQLADYRRALEMVINEFADYTSLCEADYPAEVAKYLAEARAARLRGEVSK